MRADPAGDFDYEAAGAGYSARAADRPTHRRAPPRRPWATHGRVNVGAGAGSYEPADRDVAAVEPSAAMRAPASGATRPRGRRRRRAAALDDGQLRRGDGDGHRASVARLPGRPAPSCAGSAAALSSC